MTIKCHNNYLGRSNYLGLLPVVPPVDPITTIIAVGGIVITGLLSLVKLFTGRRGGYKKFSREMYPEMKGIAQRDNKPVAVFWFGEGISVTPKGEIIIIGKFLTELLLIEFLKQIGYCVVSLVGSGGSPVETTFCPVEDDDDDEKDDDEEDNGDGQGRIIDLISDKVIDWLRDRGSPPGETFIPTESEIIVLQAPQSYWWLWLLLGVAIVARNRE